MIRYASTFLSHSSQDHALVEAVAAELGRRGVLAWLDRDELHIGQDLSVALAQAIRAQATLTAFISEAALQSSWVNDELLTAIGRYKEGGREGLIKPVYLGDPLALLLSSQVLRKRWVADQSRVTMLGVPVDPALSAAAAAPSIADRIAESIFRSIDTAGSRNIVIHLDQRGSARRGPPEGIPANRESMEGIGLVFRPRRGPGQQKETIVSEEWMALAATMMQTLSTALRGVRWHDQKRIFISGNCQLGVAYLLGHHFNRSSDAILYCEDTRNGGFNNAEWDRTDTLLGGNPDCEANTTAGLPPLPDGAMSKVAIVVGRENILHRARPYLEAALPDIPVAWVRTPQLLTSSEGLRQLIADVTALLTRLVRNQRCNTAYLVLGLPFTAVPLLAAHMLYVIPRIILLEHRGDAAVSSTPVNETYAQLEFPQG